MLDKCPSGGVSSSCSCLEHATVFLIVASPEPLELNYNSSKWKFHRIRLNRLVNELSKVDENHYGNMHVHVQFDAISLAELLTIKVENVILHLIIV